MATNTDRISFGHGEDTISGTKNPDDISHGHGEDTLSGTTNGETVDHGGTGNIEGGAEEAMRPNEDPTRNHFRWDSSDGYKVFPVSEHPLWQSDPIQDAYSYWGI